MQTRAPISAAICITSVLWLAACAGLPACTARDEEAPAAAAHRRADFSPLDHTLVFADEFEGAQLDRSAWCTRYVFGDGPALQVPDDQCAAFGKGTLDFFNDERQRYRDLSQDGQQLHRIGGGRLALRAVRLGSTEPPVFESAMIRSKRQFLPQDGRSLYVTARLKLPRARGSWPAFWMIPGPAADGGLAWPPEITMVDAALNEDGDEHDMAGAGAVVKGAQTASGKREITFSHPRYSRWGMFTADRTLRKIWVEFAVWWSPQRVCFYLDGEPTVCENYRWVRDDGRPAPGAQVMVNLAVGGRWAGRNGIDATAFPIDLEVDHVRIYEGPAPAALLRPGGGASASAGP